MGDAVFKNRRITHEIILDLYRKNNITPVIELQSSAPREVSLAPGDVIDIKFYYAPELNESQPVRPDGAVSLQLVGDVFVQGLNPAELRKKLMDLFAPHLRNPDAAVVVRSLVNRRVFVGGQVNAPGLIEMPGRLTVLEAIMQAGGFHLETAEVCNVVVIRHKDGRRYGCALDFGKALEGEEFLPFSLEPYDIVYVPETTITRVTKWIDQHINQVIPIGFVSTVSRGDSTFGLSTGTGPRTVYLR